MIRCLVKISLLLACAFALMGTALPDSTYKMPLGVSRWCIGSHRITANIALNESLFSDMKGLKDRHYNFATGSDSQLQRIASEFLQPYLDQKLSVSVNGKRYPVKVDKLVRQDNSIYTIWISINDADFDRPLNQLKIDYQVLFEEIKNNHMNQAYYYRSEATGAAVQKLFDSVPAGAQYDFINNGRPWELTVRGTAPLTAAGAPNPGQVAATVSPGSAPGK